MTEKNAREPSPWLALLATGLMVLAAGCSSSDGGEEGDDAAVAQGAGADGGGPLGGGAGGSGEGTPGAGAPGASSTPTWWGGAGDIVQRRCAGCHQEGNVAPFSLVDYDSAFAFRSLMAFKIQSGEMPPWHADPECRRYQRERMLSSDEEETLLAWLHAEAPEGVRAEGQALVPPGGALEAADIGPPTMTLQAKDAYTPKADLSDDYRCIVLPYDFPEMTYIRGALVVPDKTAVVHHVVLYAIPPERVADVEALDAAGEGEGYTCFGGAGVPGIQQLGGWVPGTERALPPETDAFVIEAGSRIVMQMHYNVLTAEPIADQSALDLYLLDEPPKNQLVSIFLINGALFIPAGEKESEHSQVLRNSSVVPWTVVGVAPHMHLRGRSLTLEAPDEPEADQCLVHVPRYDFQWQQQYSFRPGEEVVIDPGERFRLTCVYDNSAENQPFVDGKQVEPQDLTWGEGTFDEMCLATLRFRVPYLPTSDPGGETDPVFEGACGDLDACRAGCAEPDSFACLTDCSMVPGVNIADCLRCALTALGQGCGATCVASAGGMTQCAADCIVEDGATTDLSQCLARRCPEKFDEISACVDPLLADPNCGDEVDLCNQP